MRGKTMRLGDGKGWITNEGERKSELRSEARGGDQKR